ncbi:protein OSB1, mitochondrial isoform X1 [Dendrobium catenatum]|uniref:protein OSB1, mitochondrial isoform X1 n=1 Tax=Dendrobium catenatum TaxID=906689 RepID=UPI0009F21D07|nr:protein OSB1, mitochondrial isoform X1 [Dendrobium catenatum]
MRSLSRFLSSCAISQSFFDNFSSGPFVSFFSSFSSGSIVPESIAYRRSMLRPPSIAAPRKLRYNVCSFIGTIVSRVRSSGECSHGMRAFAFLKVRSDPRLQNSSCFCVCLRMQGKLAEISLQHLKQNDFIYVSGPLGSYERINASGRSEIIYKVFVQDLNFVRRLEQHCTTSMPVEPDAGKLPSSLSGSSLKEEMAGESGTIPEKQNLERLHLWQLFFASPSEWWDNRRSKKNPSFPDFKHKDTKECLWLSPDDPPWVREQLQLYDANIASSLKRDANILLDSCKWKFKDF